MFQVGVGKLQSVLTRCALCQLNTWEDGDVLVESLELLSVHTVFSHASDQLIANKPISSFAILFLTNFFDVEWCRPIPWTELCKVDNCTNLVIQPDFEINPRSVKLPSYPKNPHHIASPTDASGLF